MKKHIQIFILCPLLLLSACTKFLEEKPLVNLDFENFYQDETDALTGLNAAYAALKTNGYYRQIFPTVLLTACDIAGSNNIKNIDFNQGTVTSTSSQLGDIWTSIYVAIKEANVVIERVPQIADMDISLRDRIVGEARFLRALHYFILVRIWGKVPVRLNLVAPEDDGYLPVSEISEVYNVVIQDLKYAAEKCWKRGEERDGKTNELGRATQEAAHGMLAQVYLHIASSARSYLQGGTIGLLPYGVFSNYEAYYDSCIQEATWVIEKGNSHLLSNFAGIFEALAGNNEEILFDVQSSSTPGQGSAISNLFCPRNSGLAGSGFGGNHRIYADFMKLKAFKDETGIDTSDIRFHLSIIKEYQDLDWKYTILAEGNHIYSAYKRESLSTGEAGNNLAGTYTSKYIDTRATTEYTSSQNWHVLRLSEVYLMRAEALAEKSGIPSNAYPDINEVRSYRNVPDIDDSYLDNFRKFNIETYSYETIAEPMEKFREAILHERTLELLMEGHRYYDILRLGKLLEKNKATKGNADPNMNEYYGNDASYFWAIPQIERDTNPAIQ